MLHFSNQLVEFLFYIVGSTSSSSNICSRLGALIDLDGGSAADLHGAQGLTSLADQKASAKALPRGLAEQHRRRLPL